MTFVNVKTFTPENSGNVGRDIRRQNIKGEESSALAQTLGIKAVKKSDNANTISYSGQVDFPQPSVVGFGRVTSAGARSTPFLSDKWVISKGGTGLYTITHNLGFTNYVVSVTASDVNARIISIGGETATKFDIRTFNTSGTATDTAFHFIVYIQ